MPDQTLAQQRAADALRKIELVMRSDYASHYVRYIKGLPASILMIGLGQTSGMLLAGGKNANDRSPADERAYQMLYDHLSSWLCHLGPHAPYHNNNGLIQNLTDGTQDLYMRAQTEAIEYLEWLKKFAVAFLKDEQ